MHLLVFFSLLVESFVIFFRQFICRVVTIILLVSNFPDLVRSFRSSSFTLQNFQDKPCCDNSAYGTIKYAQKKFLWRHFIKFVENQIYLILPRHVVKEVYRSFIHLEQRQVERKSRQVVHEDRGKNRHGNRNVKHDLRPPISGIKI